MAPGFPAFRLEAADPRLDRQEARGIALLEPGGSFDEPTAQALLRGGA